MSGSISAPAGGGMPPQGGQMPPQLLAMLMQQMRGQGAGGPVGAPGPMQAGGPMPQPQPPQMPQPMPAQQPIPGPMPGGMSNNYGAPVTQRGQMQQMAQRGRNGDSMMAHLTPGEIAVPPQVQTPQLLAALQQAFKGAGADVRQFAAGSPFAAHNPNTGQQEFSLWSAILPVIGGVVGSVLPGVGTAAGAALGGAAGGAAGGLVDHASPLGVLAGAAGGGLGGYAGMGGLGGLLDSAPAAGAAGAAGAAAPAASAAPAAATGAATAAPLSGAPMGDAGQAAMAARMASGDSPAMMTAGAIPKADALSPTLMQSLKGGMAAGMGAGIGQSLAPPPNQGAPQMTGPLNQPMGPVNPNLSIGGRPAMAQPNFTGYNPYSSVTSGSPFRFYS